MLKKYTVLEKLFSEVTDFTNLPHCDQLASLNIHLIKIGSLRREFYKSQRILFRDQTIVNETIISENSV